MPGGAVCSGAGGPGVGDRAGEHQGFSRTERDRQKILALWQDGFFAGRRAAEAVRDFWTRETPSAGTPE